MSDPTCPTCGQSITPPDPPQVDPPYDNAADGLEKCPDCNTSGRDPVNPSLRCGLCEGAGWV